MLSVSPNNPQLAKLAINSYTVAPSFPVKPSYPEKPAGMVWFWRSTQHPMLGAVLLDLGQAPTPKGSTGSVELPTPVPAFVARALRVSFGVAAHSIRVSVCSGISLYSPLTPSSADTPNPAQHFFAHVPLLKRFAMPHGVSLCRMGTNCQHANPPLWPL